MFTKHWSIMIFITLAAALLAACSGLRGMPETVSGSGNVVTENREVSGFTAVTLQGMGEVNIDQTGSESLSITADDNFLPYLETVVQGNTLYIRTNKEIVFTDVTELTFAISAAELESVELAGAGSFNIENLDTEQWQVSLPGAGGIKVSGRATEQTVQLSGAGAYNAEKLESQKATVNSSGAGLAVVNVSDTLDVTINGLGGVEYIGDPEVSQKINGLGKVSKRP